MAVVENSQQTSHSQWWRISPTSTNSDTTDHPVAAMRATHGHGEGTDTRELGRTGLYVHGLGLPVIHIHACRIKRASWRRRDPLVKLWWLQR
jgi:hypothetical protein